MLWREPTLLWLLVGVILFAAFVTVAVRRRAGLLRSFAEAGVVERLTPSVDRRRRTVRAALRVVALVFLVLALAGPRWGFHWEEVRREGIDLIVAVDVSRSMLATDVKPNRLERAKLAILDLVQLLRGDRVGLVAFAGTAFLECPLTLDYAAFERSLRALDTGIIPRGGTALARAIDTSLEAFEARQGKYEALVLITDGEDHEGSVEEAAQRAADRGVKVYTVGIGTAEGELIPLAGEGGQIFVKDRQGQVVKSRLSEGTLEEIAAKTGGAYVRGLGAALGLDQVFTDHIAKMERRDISSSLERRYEERFQFPLGLSLLLLVAESLIGERRAAAEGVTAGRWFRRRGGRAQRPASRVAANTGAATIGMAGVLVLMGLLPGLNGWFDPQGDRAAEGNRLYDAAKYNEAGEKYGEGLVDAPESALLQFNLAAALYKQGKYAEASTALERVLASGDPQWVARAAYNLGNVYYRLGANAESGDPKTALASYEKALASYRRAMGADSQDTDAKFNHEFVTAKLADLKKKIEEQEQQQQQDQEQQDQEQQDQEQQDQEQQKDKERQQQEQQAQDQQRPDAAEQQKQEGQQQEQQAAEQQDQGQAQEQAGQAQREEEGAGAQDEREQAPRQAAGAGGEEQAQEKADEQAAQAVLDTARSEELGPEDVQRPTGAALSREPLQDW